MFKEKLKKLNNEEYFTDHEIVLLNQFLVNNRKIVRFDPYYSTDDLISDIFCLCLENKKKGFKYTESCQILYHIKAAKNIINKKYKNRLNYKQLSIDNTNYYTFDEIGDLNRISTVLKRTNQNKLYYIFNCIIENILYGNKFNRDKLNIRELCRKVNINHRYFYGYLSEIRGIYEQQKQRSFRYSKYS